MDCDKIPEELERGVNRLRNTNPEKFRAMCKMHLSFLLDLSGSSFEEFLDDDDENLLNVTTKQKSKSKTPFTKKKDKNMQNISGASLSQECISQVYQLVQYLGKSNNIQQEGLFRKNGHLQRQKQLKEQLCAGLPLGLENGDYCAHDCANVLKQYLGDLQEPLLSDRYYKAHCQVPDMVPKDWDCISKEEKNRIFNNQLKSIQLLFHLLPLEQSTLLECLLKLLHKVSQVPENKMTADNLGTLFAPHILCPRKITAIELRAVSKNITKAVSFMIENALHLFKIPIDLAHDISTYWKEMEQAPDSRPGSRASSATSSSDEDPDLTNERFGLRDSPSTAINTCITFVDRVATKAAQASTDTETALAQLYAHVQSMPDSAQKQKLLKQFNNMNGGVSTPIDTTGDAKNRKRKRTKSFGTSLKKHFMKNRKIKAMSVSNEESLSTSQEDFLSTSQFTPFHSSFMNKENELPSMCLSSCRHVRTPVKKLFSEAYQTPEQVCVVDMEDLNESLPSPILKTNNKRKRRRYSMGNDSLEITPLSNRYKSYRYKEANILSMISPVAKRAMQASTLSKAMTAPRCRAPLSVFRSPVEFQSNCDFVMSPRKKHKMAGCFV